MTVASHPTGWYANSLHCPLKGGFQSVWITASQPGNEVNFFTHWPEWLVNTPAIYFWTSYITSYNVTQRVWLPAKVAARVESPTSRIEDFTSIPPPVGQDPGVCSTKQDYRVNQVTVLSKTRKKREQLISMLNSDPCWSIRRHLSSSDLTYYEASVVWRIAQICILHN